jgi:hypothetical protein
MAAFTLAATDTTAPALSTATIASNGTTLTLVFDEAVVGGAGIEIDDAGPGVTATYASGSGTDTLVFTLGRTILSSETVTLDYVPNDIEDLAGNPLASISNRAVTNNSTQTADVTPPTLSSAVIDSTGTYLTLGFSESVVGTDSDGLVLTGQWGSLLATYESGSGTSSLVFELSRPAYASEVVSLAYAPGNIEDAAGNALASVSSAVTNGSTVTIPALLYQHLKDGDEIPGANSAVLTIASVDSGDAGEYSIRITNTATNTSVTIAAPEPVVVT